MISLVSTFRPFKHEFSHIQLNALRSWLQFCPPCEIIIVGQEEGIQELVEKHKKYDIKYIPTVMRNKFGTPLLNDIIYQAEKIAKNKIIGLVNSDIIILKGLLETTALVAKKYNKFLIVSKRWELQVKDYINFEDPNWKCTLLNELTRSGYKMNLLPIDLLIFPKKMFMDVPPFAIGRGLWVRWFIYKALTLNAPVIDASDAIPTVHQVHSYWHVSSSVKGTYQESVEFFDNMKKIGYAAYFSDEDINYEIKEGKIVERKNFNHILRRIIKAPIIYSSLNPLLTLLSLSPTHGTIINHYLRRLLRALKLFY